MFKLKPRSFKFKKASFRYSKTGFFVFIIVFSIGVFSLLPTLKKQFSKKDVGAATASHVWDVNEKNAGYNYNRLEMDLNTSDIRLKPLPKEFTFSADSSNFLDNNWDMIGGVPVIKTDESGDKYYSVAGGSNLAFLSIPINTNFTYTLSGEFRSSGTIPSKTLFALAPKTEDYSDIMKYEYYKNASFATLANYDENLKTITVTNASDLTGWMQNGSALDHTRSIGFYFDGNTDKIPDFSFITSELSIASESIGSYSTINGNTINLNHILPSEVKQRIIPGVTKLANLSSGSSYLYVTSTFSELPTTFTTLKSTYTGTNKNLIPSTTIFPQNTKWANILLLPNHYGQDKNSTTDFDNIKLTITGDQPLYSWQKPSVTAKYPQNFAGKLTKMSHNMTAGTDNQIGYQLSTDGGITWKYFDKTLNS